MISNVGGKEVAGKMLKSTTRWDEDGNGIDAFGFNVLPAGIREYSGLFVNMGRTVYFWSATEDIINYVYVLYLSYNYESANLVGRKNNTVSANSVRCLRGSN